MSKYPSSISLWTVRSDSPKAPRLRGVIQITRELIDYLTDELGDDEQVSVDVSIWRNESEHEKAPQYKGSVTPPRKQDDDEEEERKPKQEKAKRSFSSRSTRSGRVL